MEKKSVSIVIPNYNGAKLLAKNLPSVIHAVKFFDPKTEIIVVDDNSKDQSVSLLLKNFPQIKIVRKAKNEGFSATCNIGVKQATGEIVVLLNTDISPEINFLQPLVNHFADKNVFAAGCLDKSYENGEIRLRGNGEGYFYRGFVLHKRGNVNNTKTFWVSGGSGAFSREKWLILRGLDELYNPFYWEDIDLSYRARKLGWQVLFEKESIVNHRHEEGSILAQYTNAQIVVTSYRNQFIFFWKNITDFNFLLIHLYYLPYHIIKSVLKRDTLFLMGFLQATKRLPKIIGERRKFLKLWENTNRLSDKILLVKLWFFLIPPFHHFVIDCFGVN